ncbi:branched-chain amino acid ABC transporter permease [Nocardioides euryhalodurans]|uniref:Branched-chain amino acid ABC transporter permease n=1 Tax=Nocardioides euryhalodurans TaxID=2518370 RepID=A0A4P7GGG7_9ACTN|nr:branched-chain amino acid ABC transporter permease [Nocardioides euryhalodurans]QBR90896.1 branched-chain amino acid ABC transporter permease [Nocardioides euryhalodurans]
MHTPRSRLVVAVGALLALLGIALATASSSVAATASPASAAGMSGAASECALPTPTDDDTISILGRICDRRETPQVGVEGVDVTVEDEEGAVVGEATSGADGTFVIDLPGDAVSLLGSSFTVSLDEESLPEDTEPEVLSRTVPINLDNDQSVTFPIGEAGAAGAGFAVEALQLTVGGLVFSSLLAMAALGLSMIFGTTGLTNFSHGELITFGALVAYAFDQLPGEVTVGGVNITIAVGVVVAFIVSGAFGWLNDAALWRPLRHRGTGIIAMMIVSIGLSIFLRNLYQYFAGAQSRNYSQYSAVTPLEIGPLLITPKEIIVFVVAMAALLVTTALLQYTRIGKATRAVADNPALSASTGINVERVISIVWIGGTALAGLSGALLGLTQGFDYQIGFKILLLVFAAVVLGGLGTIWGAIVGAFIIGLFTELTTLFVPAEFKFVGALLVLIVVLLIRPQGLLGKAQRVG